MKKKNNLRVKKKSPDMVLHRTFRGTRATPVSSATQGLAHKLRTLSVPITDIRKDNSLHSLGLEDQGHGVWRFNTNPKPTRYHRHIRVKGNKEENSSEDVANKNPINRRGGDGGSKTVMDGLGENYIAQSEGKKTTRRNAAKVIPIVIDVSSSDEENMSVCEPATRVKDRKMRLSASKSDEGVDKKVIRRMKNKNSDIQVETEVESTSELKSRSSRSQSRIGSVNESDTNPRGKKATAEVRPTSRRDGNAALPLGTNGIKRNPKIVFNHLAPPLKRSVPSLKNLKLPAKGTGSKMFESKDKGSRAQQKNDEGHSQLVTRKYGLRSVTPSEGSDSRKRKREIRTVSASEQPSKLVRTQQFQVRKSEGSRRASGSSSLPNSSKEEKSVGYPRKKTLTRKMKKNSGSKKGGENDVDFKVSPSTTAEGKALPKLKLTRKHQSKFQMQWCEICGVELHSLDNKLEHEFSHQEPRQLFVSLHHCHLNHSSVKLPIYVSSEDLASIPDPQEDTYSPIASDDDSHPLLPLDNILNDEEENAYESLSSSDDENGAAKTEGPLADDSTQDPPQGVPNGMALGDAVVSPGATPDRSMPIKSPKSLGSKERSKRKSQVKMRLWEGPPITRSGRVVKISQKTKEGIEQLACVRALFSGTEVEGGSVCNTTVAEEESLMGEKLVEEESAGEEKLIPHVDEYVEVVVMKGDLKDIVKSDARDLETVIDKFPKEDVSSVGDLSPADEIKTHGPSSEENDTLETEDPVSADTSTIEDKDMPVENEEVNDEQNEKDKDCISSGDFVGVGLSPVEQLILPEASLGEDDVLGNEVQTSMGSSITNKEDALVKTKEVNDVLDEKDKGCIFSENNVNEVEEVENSVKKDDVTENECGTTPDMNQNIIHEVESEETLEKQTNSLASETIVEVHEGEVSVRLGEGAVTPDDMSEQKTGNDNVQESKVSELCISEAVPERDSGDMMPGDRIGIGELLEDAIDDNSKDIMLVDESNDVLVGGTLTENIEMQESSETEFISVPSDIDISKFNMPEDQGLEDISDDDWTDISDKEMQQSPQYVNGQLGDVEMDVEGPASGVDNVGQEGEMDLEENEKDAGLPDPMCTGEVINETLEQEMKDLENTDDEIMTENVVDEMVGVLSPKDNVSIADGGESAAEVDMAEAVEDPEDGSMAEVIDTIQEEEEAKDSGKALGEVEEKVNVDEEAPVEGGGESGGVVALDLLREGKVVEVHIENESQDASKGENCALSCVTLEEVAAELPAQAKVPVNGIELVAVVESGKEHGSDRHSGQKREEVAESSDSNFSSSYNGGNADVLKECGFKVKNDLCAASRNIEPNKLTLGQGSELSGSN